MSKTSKILLLTFLGLLTLYSGYCVFLYLNQEKYIFFPTSLSSEKRELLKQNYPDADLELVTGDGVTLQGWLLKNSQPNSKGLLIYYGGNAEDVSNRLADAEKIPGISQLYLNYRGYGRSGGRPSEEAFIQDALLAFDTMVKKEGFAPKDIVLMGRSLGTGVAVQVAHRRKVKGVILVTPYDSVRAMAQQSHRFFPVGWLLKHTFDSIRYAPDIHVPLLMIIAKDDRTIPMKNSMNLFQKWGGEKKMVTIPDADHHTILSKPPYWQAIRQFIDGLDSDRLTLE